MEMRTRRGGLLALVLMAAPAAALRAQDQTPGSSGWAEARASTRVAAVVGLDRLATSAERARFFPEAVRRLHAAPPGRHRQSEPALARIRVLANAAGEPRPERADGWRVPLPLPPRVWTDVVLRRPVPDDALLAAILADRRAALLAYGFSALDEATLAALAERPRLVDALARRSPGLVAAFGRSVRIRDGRVEVPGGEPARPLWEGLVGAPVTDVDRFIATLFAADEGRRAYFYDTVAALDAPRARFALGLWLSEPERPARLAALYREVVGSYRVEWQPEERPFSRVVADVAWLLGQARVEPDGRPSPPAWRAVWDQVLGSVDVFEDVRLPPGDLPGAGFVDAARLVQLVNVAAPAERAGRLATFAFGQRVFSGATAADARELVIALRGRRRFPMLAAALERAGVRAPAVYAAAARRAAEIDALDSGRAALALRQFQGALALVVRLHQTRSRDAAAAERLVRTLVEVPLLDGRYEGSIAAWMTRELLPLAARAPATLGTGDRPEEADRDRPIERALIAALAGAGSPAEAARLRPLRWEGLPYRLDVVTAERARVEAIRARQGGASLDEALAVADLAARLHDRAGSPASLGSLATELRALGDRLRAPPGVLLPDGAGPEPSRVLARAAAELAQAAGRAHPDAERIRATLTALGEALLADVLASITYALALGERDSRAVRGSNVARRHDFGLDRAGPRTPVSAAWRLPEAQVVPGEPWHVRGALVNLDVGLAEFALRRVDATGELRAPSLNSNDRRTVAQSVALLDVFDLTDRDRDAIARALGDGTRRVQNAVRDARALDGLASEAGLDAWRRQHLLWLAAREPDAVLDLFTLTELVRLGRPTPDVRLDAWGASALPADGCVCLRFFSPLDWASTTGRAEAGLLTARLPDLAVRVAALLAELDLPAALARAVLAAAAQAFVDRVDPAHADDWPALARWAARLSREDVEDYVAAQAAGGVLVPDSSGFRVPGLGASTDGGVR